MRSPILIAAAVVVVAAAGGGVVIAYNKGVDSTNAFYASQPTPTVTSVSVTTATVTAPPVTRTSTVTTTVTESSQAPETLELTGGLELTGADNWDDLGGGSCSGNGGYSDLQEGATVIVYDGATQYAGAGSLDAGKVSGTSCNFSVDIPDVVGGSNVYLVEVSHRGKVKAYPIGTQLLFSGTIGD